jgi:hypothetical protein
MVESEDGQKLKSEASGFRSNAFSLSPNPRQLRADRFRYRFYLGLLIFVVAAGLPILAVPALRHRLSSRVDSLKRAVRPQGPVVVMARVGENTGEFPKEYEIPVLPRASAVPYFIPSPDRIYGSGSRTPVITSRDKEPAAQPPEDAGQESPSEPEPVYRQGKLEQEAYELLVKSSDTVAGMVQGKDPSLRFKQWAAARTDDDTYLVRLTFTQTSDKTEVPYIWQVKVVSKQVSPLNYYARSVPK